MTCREIDELLFANADMGKLPADAQAHLATCPQCRALAANFQNDVAGSIDPALAERIREPLLASLVPVRLLPGTGVLAATFLVLFFVVAVAGANWLGFNGLAKLSPLSRAGIFGALLLLSGASAFAAARNMCPGARSIPGWALFSAAFLVFELLCFAFFDDYRLGSFVHSGWSCLRAGLLCALPTALLALLILRTGYVVAPASTGAIIGLGAGLAGLTVLEFHCPIQTFPHVALWHTGIFVISAAAGALAGASFRDNMQGVPKS